MLHLLLFIVFPGLINSQALAVTACGADPSGKTDSTAAFKKCLTQQPVGDITIPYGTYKLSGSIFKNRNQNLIGFGAGASILKCQSTTAPCIVAADTTGSGTNYTPSKIQDLAIEGPGTGNTSVGVLIGGDPTGAVIAGTAFGDAVNIVDSRIAGFEHGVQWGNNAWANKIVRTYIFGNASGIYTPSGLTDSGEATSITDSNIFNNSIGLEDHANFEWMIQGTSFDYNGTAMVFFGSGIHAVNCHFEQSAAPVFFQPYGSAILSIKDSTILIGSSSGSDQYILDSWPQSLLLAIDDVSIWSNHPVQYFMHGQTSITGVITNLSANGNKQIGALTSAPTTVIVTANHAF